MAAHHKPNFPAPQRKQPASKAKAAAVKPANKAKQKSVPNRPKKPATKGKVSGKPARKRG